MDTDRNLRSRPHSADARIAVPGPRVSVVMAVYNGEAFVEGAVKSVLEQDFTDFELVVVDDCSTDATRAILDSFRDDRIRAIQNTSNMGQTASLNIGVRAARGDFIARIDADDLYLPGKLRKQLEYMESHPDVAACGTWAMRIDEHGQTIGSYLAPLSDADVRFQVITGTPLCHVSVMIRAAALAEVGAYDERYRYAADIALWSALYTRGYVIRNIPEVLTVYREHGGSYGAANLVEGAAGAEAAELTIDNALRMIGYRLTYEEARAIRLRTVPRAGLTYEDRRLCRRHLSEIATRVYGRRTLRVRARIYATYVWSLTAMGDGTEPSGRRLTTHDWLALGTARVIRSLGPRAQRFVKELFRSSIR
jgi:glycosyltransferase involved in cell wall biosynthesis